MGSLFSSKHKYLPNELIWAFYDDKRILDVNILHKCNDKIQYSELCVALCLFRFVFFYFFFILILFVFCALVLFVSFPWIHFSLYLLFCSILFPLYFTFQGSASISFVLCLNIATTILFCSHNHNSVLCAFIFSANE